jgi:hypothetical protein
MKIVWPDHPAIDRANSLVFDVKVDGIAVKVYITEEAEEERGLPVCKAFAERRLRHRSIKGRLPQAIHVRASDFSSKGSGRA